MYPTQQGDLAEAYSQYEEETEDCDVYISFENWLQDKTYETPQAIIL